ncbi:MAG: PIG-L family deacetylase, partial [Chloroflexi bacterium]|nr:PIG-L family deacetylase [Chloroflexota bacterium]
MSKFNGSYIPKSAMTIFAHPDDAEFTIGGTIAKWAAAGCEITMLLCTSGNVGTHDPKYTLKTLTKTRETEQQAAADFFGVKHVVFLRYDDCALEPSLDLSRKVVREIRQYKPEVVLCGDPEGWFTFQHAGNPSYRYIVDTDNPHGDMTGLHTATTSSSNITIGGTDFGSHACSECHTSSVLL